MGLFQGLLNNNVQKSNDQLNAEYGQYLFTGEEIVMGYQLIRDAIIFTNDRIIFVDKQGATGKKTSFKSIHLDAIIEVEMETAGHVDDSEVTITWLANANQRSNNEIHKSHKFEFSKNTDIVTLYAYLGDIVNQNRKRINA